VYGTRRGATWSKRTIGFLLGRFLDKDVGEGRNPKIRARLQKVRSELELKSGESKMAQADGGFCILFSTGELFVLDKKAVDTSSLKLAFISSLQRFVKYMRVLPKRITETIWQRR